MAWLLRNSGNGYAYEAMERVVTKKNTDVYLEAMEEAPNEGSQLKEAGNSSGQGIPVGEFPIGLLANCRKPSFSMFHYKRKTRDSRIFWYPQLLRVLALMRLNRRVPVGTHGGVRGRLSIYESLLLDYGGILSFSRVTFNPPLHLTLTRCR